MTKLSMIILTLLTAFSSPRFLNQGAMLAKLECQVLEVSGPSTAASRPLAAIGYAILRHKNSDDRERLSAWLRAHSGTEITFAAADGHPHRGVLRRLRMCFGRGLLIFVDPVKLKEGQTIVIDFSSRGQARVQLPSSPGL